MSDIERLMTMRDKARTLAEMYGPASPQYVTAHASWTALQRKVLREMTPQQKADARVLQEAQGLPPMATAEEWDMTERIADEIKPILTDRGPRMEPTTFGPGVLSAQPENAEEEAALERVQALRRTITMGAHDSLANVKPGSPGAAVIHAAHTGHESKPVQRTIDAQTRYS